MNVMLIDDLGDLDMARNQLDEMRIPSLGINMVVKIINNKIYSASKESIILSRLNVR